MRFWLGYKSKRKKRPAAGPTIVRFPVPGTMTSFPSECATSTMTGFLPCPGSARGPQVRMGVCPFGRKAAA